MRPMRRSGSGSAGLVADLDGQAGQRLAAIDDGAVADRLQRIDRAGAAFARQLALVDQIE